MEVNNLLLAQDVMVFPGAMPSTSMIETMEGTRFVSNESGSSLDSKVSELANLCEMDQTPHTPNMNLSRTVRHV